MSYFRDEDMGYLHGEEPREQPEEPYIDVIVRLYPRIDVLKADVVGVLRGGALHEGYSGLTQRIQRPRAGGD